MESLRQQIQALTAIVQTLQQQVKDQQTAMEKNDSVTPPLPKTPKRKQRKFPVLQRRQPVPHRSSQPTTPRLLPRRHSVNANGANTTGEHSRPPMARSPATSSSTFDTGSSLTQPIQLTGGGNKNYMNISFDAMFASRCIQRERSRSHRGRRSRSAAARIQRTQRRNRARWCRRSLLRRVRQHCPQAR